MMKVQSLSLTKSILSIGLILILMNTSGCALYKTDFDCKYEKGLGCKSITEVNSLVDQGQFKEDLKKTSETKTLKLSAPKLPIVCYSQNAIQRVPEESIRVWIAPHSDEQGHFHEASIIHTVIRSGRWQVLEKPQC